MHTFAYEIRAVLNHDGTYKVTLYDVDFDESPVEMVIPKAKIAIYPVEDVENTDHVFLDVMYDDYERRSNE